MSWFAGIDIGGTKCAVSIGRLMKEQLRIVGKSQFPTPATPGESLRMMMDQLDQLLIEQSQPQLQGIGISCGGPLNSAAGLILSPPNLPGWDELDVVTPFLTRYGVPIALQNDANACALAEWRWGAGRGCRHMIFLTFGTGMGAGIIIDGKLYEGANGMAGELGHMRMEETGPLGYGKHGSFEGFCSGGGIARLAQEVAAEQLAVGLPPAFCPTAADIAAITAHKVGDAARQGDPAAREVFLIVGRQLGRGLAVLIDLLNPQKIVIGSIYVRQLQLLEPLVLEEISREALPSSASVCSIVPAGLGEQIGDYASLSVAMHALAQGQDSQ